MNVPDQITLQLVSGAGQDLGKIIVQMIVSTGQRNPRHIQFPKTDPAGRALLTREDFVGQFDDATVADLMGSWGTIRQALPVVEVSLYDPLPARAAKKSDWPLGVHEKTKWQSRAAEYAYRTSCRNPDFIAEPLKVDLEKTSEVQLPVQLRARGAG
jgi:hypothetical protein